MTPMVAFPSSRSKKRLLGQALIEKGRISARYAGENQKTRKKIRSSIITPLLQQAHTAQNALTRAVDPEPKTEKVRFYLTVNQGLAAATGPGLGADLP